MRYILSLTLLLSSSVIADSEDSFEQFISLKNKSIDKEICNNPSFIDNQKFCTKLSRITLNSCGKQSDWPCLEDDGCLEIERLVKQ